MEQTNNSLLTLQDYGVAFGEKIVLTQVNLSIPERGVTTLLGPGGTGKSTLLRTIAGFNSTNPSLRTWGNAFYAGETLGDGELPALVSQSARLLMASIFENVVNNLPERETLTPKQQRELVKRLLEHAGLGKLSSRLNDKVVNLSLAKQRHLAILRQAAAGPKLLCIDEPTSGLNDKESSVLIDYIKQEGKRRAVLVVLHNQEQVQNLNGYAALLAGGVIQEHQKVEIFFTTPESSLTQEFIRNGNCCVPSPNTKPEEVNEDVVLSVIPDAAREFVSDAFGPRGFLWLEKGVLAGTPRPGIFLDIEQDLKALQRVGVTVLVSLTEKGLDQPALDQFGIRNVWEPIKDMEAPTNEQAAKLCQNIVALINAGEVIAVHCRAGLGRTGTVLAAYLIWEGVSALAALETVRRVEPRWVQSQVQVDFLEEFEGYVVKVTSGISNNVVNC